MVMPGFTIGKVYKCLRADTALAQALDCGEGFAELGAINF
jgi:hypothetical protein